MPDIKQPDEQIVCPWCYSPIRIHSEDESFVCRICQRKITEEDLHYAEQQED